MLSSSRGRQGRYRKLQDLPSSNSSLSLVVYEVVSNFTGTGTITGTVSSSSTIPGPGAIAGKLVKAVGEYLLAILEKLTIKRRMWGLRRRFKNSSSFNHAWNAVSTRDAKKVCRDLVELTRSGYSHSVRQAAFGLVVLKLLGPYSTMSGPWFTSLVDEVSHLHSTLITDFFMELSALIRPEDGHCSRTRKFLYSGEILQRDDYLQSRNLSGRETIMTFTLHVVRSNQTAAKAVVDGGLLEVLVDVVSHGFEGWDSDAIEGATQVLNALANYPAVLRLMRQHDIASCWPYYIPGLRPSVMEEAEMEEEQEALLF